ncbi:MAG: SdrD B-like domain-containing protein [Caldilineales bacterium]
MFVRTCKAFLAVLLISALLPAAVPMAVAAPAAELATPAAGGGSVVCPAWKTIVIDGNNDFPAAAYIAENPFASPTAGGSTSASDMSNESSAFHWTNGWSDVALTNGNTADIRDFWVTWDANYLYIGVKGPNAMMDTDVVDLFVAIDTNGSQSGDLPQSSTPWGKDIDFDEWTPEYFIAVSNAKDTSDNNPAGYAALVPAGGSGTALTGGTDWANSAWASASDGGVYFEFRLTWAQLGLSGAPNWAGGGTPMNFAVYTTYNDSGFDGYDSAPGTGNGSTYEQIGDYKGDGDHCNGNLDPVTGAADDTCNYGESDKSNGPGIGLGGRSPGSDDANGTNEVDTIGEYYRILNVGELNQIGDLVYADLNGNGSYDSGDQPMGANVAVSLSGGSTASASTTSGGLYSFDKLTCGAFTVTVDSGTLPAPSTFGTYVAPWVATQNAGGYSKTFNTAPTGAGRLPEALDLAADFGFKPSLPTAVTVASFSSEQQQNTVRLTWETVSEQGNRGFNLYRGLSPAGWDTQLNATLIPSQAQGSSAGSNYTWTDNGPFTAGQTYYYWLQDVSTGNATALHGPVSLTFAVPTAVEMSQLAASSDARPLVALWVALLLPLLLVVGLRLRRTASRG